MSKKESKIPKIPNVEDDKLYAIVEFYEDEDGNPDEINDYTFVFGHALADELKSFDHDGGSFTIYELKPIGKKKLVTSYEWVDS